MEKYRKKKIIILLFVILLLGYLIVFSKTFLSSKERKINKSLIAMYVQNDKGEYEKNTTNNFPKEGYVLNSEKSFCKNNSVLAQNKETKNISLMTSTAEECTLYFDREIIRILDHLNLKIKNGSPNFSFPAITDETKDGLYYLEDDYGTSYYFRGAVENNYVKFGKNANGQDMWWRIIRINGDGSLRIEYDGTQAHANGELNNDRLTFVNIPWNTLINDVKYVGYMFGGAQGEASLSREDAIKNETDSDIKTAIDNWYVENIVNTGYEKYISDEIFCNDRTIPGKEKTNWESDTSLGFGTNPTAFGGTERLGVWNDGIAKNVSFSCKDKNDAFTILESEKGNGNLTYPVGLITVDEAVAAGSDKYLNNENTSYYLYKNESRWTFTPLNMQVIPDTYMFKIYNGSTNFQNLSFEIGASVVINISRDYVINMLGNGTMENPFYIENK